MFGYIRYNVFASSLLSITIQDGSMSERNNIVTYSSLVFSKL